MQILGEWYEWLAVALAILIAAGYEVAVVRRARRDPTGVARTAHGDFRAAWAIALGRQPGSEIIAVQTLRNSLMSATIIASTAALALMGSVSLLGTALTHGEPLIHLSPRTAIALLLMADLFCSFVSSALSMRMYNHAGFLMAFPVNSPQRRALEPVAALYVRRAGFYYSWSLRLFFCVAPLVAGLFAPVLTPFTTIGLLWALAMFDRPPPSSSSADVAEAVQAAGAAVEASTAQAHSRSVAQAEATERVARLSAKPTPSAPEPRA